MQFRRRQLRSQPQPHRRIVWRGRHSNSKRFLHGNVLVAAARRH
jgi:hypothetical protein